MLASSFEEFNATLNLMRPSVIRRALRLFHERRRAVRGDGGEDHGMLRRRKDPVRDTGPILRATTDQGHVWDDPSEDLLFELLGDVEEGVEQFFIVERLADQSGEIYAQVILSEGGGWLIERRDGAADRHFAATMPDKRAVHVVLTGWAFELPGWESKAPWAQVGVYAEVPPAASSA